MGAIAPILPLYTISLGPLFHKILRPPLPGVRELVLLIANIRYETSVIDFSGNLAVLHIMVVFVITKRPSGKSWLPVSPIVDKPRLELK